MFLRNGKLNILPKIANHYLNLVYKTSQITFHTSKPLTEEDITNSLIGFWHGESCLMYLVGKKLQKQHVGLSTIVTADKRGDYIEAICKEYGIETLRVKDGIKTKKSFEDIQEAAKCRGKSLCIALDGPVGPAYKPKKLLFYLAHGTDKSIIGIKVKTSRTIKLTKRWDEYRIPLPFMKMEVNMYFIKKITQEDLNHFRMYSEEVKRYFI